MDKSTHSGRINDVRKSFVSVKSGSSAGGGAGVYVYVSESLSVDVDLAGTGGGENWTSAGGADAGYGEYEFWVGLGYGYGDGAGCCCCNGLSDLALLADAVADELRIRKPFLYCCCCCCCASVDFLLQYKSTPLRLTSQGGRKSHRKRFMTIYKLRQGRHATRSQRETLFFLGDFGRERVEHAVGRE